MFSQFIHILNIWTILLSTVGVATYSHYCQDKLKTVSFFVDTTKSCCKKTKSKCASKVLPQATACCSSSKKTRILYKNCFTKQQSEKTSLKKKNCCLYKKFYNQSDSESALEQLDLDIAFEYYPIVTNDNLNFIAEGATFYAQNLGYTALCFFPPPDVPLYILHQSFLC